MNALSHTTGYAIVALSFVGSSDRPLVQARDIAAATGIPKPYLSKILGALGKAGLLHTKRGIGGGVTLARPAETVTLLDVVNAIEATEESPRCFLAMSACNCQSPCPMHDFWTATTRQVRQQLQQCTLEQIARHQSQTGFRTPSLTELLRGLPLTPRVYATKPTGRFMRKFGVKK